MSKMGHNEQGLPGASDHVRQGLLPSPSVPSPILRLAASRWVSGQRWGARPSRRRHAWPAGATRSTQPAGLQGAGRQCQSGSVPGHPPQGRASCQPWAAAANPHPVHTQPLDRGHLSWSHSHLGFFFQAASKASRQSAFSATRAFRRLSVLGCSLRAGTWVVRCHATHRLVTTRPALPRRVKGPFPSNKRSRRHHLSDPTSLHSDLQGL